MTIKLEKSWKIHVAAEFMQPYFEELSDFIRSEYREHEIYPKPGNIFKALDLVPFEDVKVVILGQDPYHGEGQAHGLSFSVPDGVRMPPSLQNIYKEIVDDIGGKMPKSGNLEHWAEQGVLLLNSTLTVAAKSPGSHQGKGWERFTDAIIKALSDNREGLVFILWGNYARQKGQVIDRKKHLVLEAPHPSPFSAHKGFFGCKHFSKANEYLFSGGHDPIHWV